MKRDLTSDGGNSRGDVDVAGDDVAAVLLDTVVRLMPEAPPSMALLREKSLPQLGIASLGAIAVQYRIDAAFQVMVPTEELLSDRTLDALIEHVRASRADDKSAADPQPA
jgi:Phosphopantetheine attachment site